MSKFKLDELDHQILEALIENARTPFTDIAKNLLVSAGTIHVRVKKMEDEGVIKRVADKNDKRVTRICLTKKGIEKRDQSRLAVIQLNEVIQANLTKKERKDFFSIMNKIDASIKTKHIFD